VLSAMMRRSSQAATPSLNNVERLSKQRVKGMCDSHRCRYFLGASFGSSIDRKTSLQNAAIQERAKAMFYKPGNYVPSLFLPGQKGFDVFGNHMIQNAFFRTARVIFIGSFTNPAIWVRK
jgi:hypothetical protein